MNVIKASGEKELFDEEKVRYSINRAGITGEMQDKVLAYIKGKVYDNIHTSEIYNFILESLDQTEKPFKARYSLKQAIMDLGPTGYPFEDLIGEILKAKGYETEVGVILDGKCVKHEVDVIAIKDGKKILIEAKFHNRVGTRSDLHVSLYTKSRFEDLREKHGFDEAWIVTNTKASLDAIAYAACVGMKVISWGYPEDGGLRDLIEQTRLQPITQINTLSTSQKQILMENHVVLCRDILKEPNVLNDLGLQNDKKQKVLEEADFICSLKLT